MRRAGIVLVTVLALTAGGALVAPARAATPATPGRIDSLPGGDPGDRGGQLVVGQHPGGGADLPAGPARGPVAAVRGPMPARVGYNGFSANRREGDGTTPAGTFGFVYGFGSRPDPGMRGFSYRRLRPNSCWSGSRADDNRWVTRPCTYGESLWKNRRVAYRHAALIDFSYRRPVYKKGSGIFLHQQTGGPTAGWRNRQ
jgi:hypothetical protein